MRRSLLFPLLLLAIVPPPAGAAQPAAPAPSIVRYHYGDNSAWANAQFDDSAWPEAEAGAFPAPPYESDGFFWVRARVAVPPGMPGPLAIEAQTLEVGPYVQEVWLNNHLIGRYGDFPPRARALVPPQILAFDIPAGVAQPGSVAIVALRVWNTPSDESEALLPHRDPVSVALSIGSAPLLHARAAEAQDRAWLRFWPQLSLALVFIMLGLAVLALGIWARDRSLLLCALWLVALPAFLVFRSLLSPLAGVSAPVLFTVFLIVNAIGMCVDVEFIWTVQGFRDRVFRAASHLCWIGLTIGEITSALQTHPGVLVSAEMLTGNWLLFAFNVITSGANLAALAGRGRNRPVAAALLLISVGYFLGIAGTPLNVHWLGLNFFGAAFYLCTLFVALLLMRQTWTAWRRAENLRVEFAAAREVQQQLVPAEPPPIPGWHMQAAYLPAMDVGGDFYHVIELPRATVLLIGDVSGKGLKAAMTGLLTIGAASALASDSAGPAQLLERLNRKMVALQKDGFITCLCAHITPEGALTLANAGHLPPYRNGQEIQVPGSLPLGLNPNTDYSGITLQLAPGDTLTFLSDGVVEAQSATGELFGFDRTRQISSQSAEQIAHTAQTHGQQDDITVLTLTFAPAEFAHA